MITVAAADEIILSQTRDYGYEERPFEQALGMVLAEDLKADRPMPPYNRVMMDGIALSYSSFFNGIRSFRIKATQAAGEHPINIDTPDECIEIMTGAALPETTDTVIPYEALHINDDIATITAAAVIQGQSIHYRGSDKKQHDVMAAAGAIVTPAILGIAASIGAATLKVRKMPKTIIISNGDELVSVNKIPNPYQVRRSNGYTLKAALQQYGMEADMIHLPDNEIIIETELKKCIGIYDIILLSGGISMGKFDLVPAALEKLAVNKLFHKVQQRPGKPFWFGTHECGALVFAFPGNPVSTFMCLYRYFVPWLKKCLNIADKKFYAALACDYTFTPALQYFMQVSLHIIETGQITAIPLPGNGSGDFSNLADADAFMELPLEKDNFKQGEVYRIWPFKPLL